MRYVLTDSWGKSHAYFDTRDGARNALLEIEVEDPESFADLYVAAYEGASLVWGPETAARMLYRVTVDWSAVAPVAAQSAGAVTLLTQGITPPAPHAGPSRLEVVAASR